MDYPRCKKYQFCLLFKYLIILSRKTCFLKRTSANSFSGSILHKTKRYQNFKFLTNHGVTPLEKCQFCGFLKPMFSLFRMACLLYKTSKIVYWRFIFTIYDMGIQGVTRSYKRLQGVTRGYKGLQSVTEGYKR